MISSTTNAPYEVKTMMKKQTLRKEELNGINNLKLGHWMLKQR